MKKQYLILSAFSLIIFASLVFVNAQLTSVNFSNPTTVQTTYSNPNIVVQTLKYNPYPVSAGEWFDVWILIQNIGQEDAKDVRFELVPDNTFISIDNNIQDVKTILGSVNSYKLSQSNDGTYVILKYRIKVADNAPNGESNLKFKTTLDVINPSSQSIITNLPITIGKTKTDFDVVMQDSTTQGTSFSIANTGENAANAVTLTVVPKSGLNITGSISSILGNLAQGDFTTVTFQIFPTKTFLENSDHDVIIKIAYTDTSGVRNIIEKNVTLNIKPNFGSSNGRATQSKGIPGYYYLIIGIILGIVLVFAYRKIKKKK